MKLASAPSLRFARLSPLARLLAVLACGLLSALSARAQNIYFSVDATFLEIGPTNGYTVGASYRFVFEIGSFAENSGEYTWAEPTHNQWGEAPQPSPALVTSVFGSTGGGRVAFLGTYSRPDGQASLSLSHNTGENRDVFTIQTNGSGLGYKTPAGNDITSLTIDLQDVRPSTAFAYAGSYTDPVEYFSDYLQNNITLAGPDLNFYVGTTGDTAFFQVTSFSISSTPPPPVPEPSTYAALAGAAVLGLAAWRRRGQRATRPIAS